MSFLGDAPSPSAEEPQIWERSEEAKAQFKVAPWKPQVKCVDISTFGTDQREQGLCAEGIARA